MLRKLRWRPDDHFAAVAAAAVAAAVGCSARSATRSIDPSPTVSPASAIWRTSWPNRCTVRSGAVLVYPVVEHEGEDEIPPELDASEVTIALVFVAPTSTGSPDGRLVQFVVRDKSRSDEPIVDSPDP